MIDLDAYARAGARLGLTRADVKRVIHTLGYGGDASLSGVPDGADTVKIISFREIFDRLTRIVEGRVTLDDCPNCGRIVCPLTLPASLLGQEHQEWECSHCGALLVRDFAPGRPAVERAWRIAPNRWTDPATASDFTAAPFNQIEGAA